MKSANHKPFLVAFGVAAAVSLIIYAVLILPNTSKASDALKKIKASEETLRGFGMGQGIDFEDALKKYTDRKTSLSELKDKTLTTLSFKLDSDYILTPDTTPEVQFPIIKNRIVADIRDAYPGFPFDASLGFPDLP